MRYLKIHTSLQEMAPQYSHDIILALCLFFAGRHSLGARCMGFTRK